VGLKEGLSFGGLDRSSRVALQHREADGYDIGAPGIQTTVEGEIMQKPLVIIITILTCASMGALADCIDYAGEPDLALLGGIDLPGHARDVAVGGGHAYVAVYDEGLQVIDVGDPSQPVIVGAADTPGGAYRVDLVGNMAFVADLDGGVQFIDVSDPAAPVVVGSYPLGNCYDVFATGSSYDGYLVFAVDYEDGLVVLRVDDPASPELITVAAVPGNAVGIAGYHSHFIGGDIPGLAGYELHVACQSGGMQEFFYDFGDDVITWLHTDLPGYTRAIVPVGSRDGGDRYTSAWLLTANMQAGLQVVDHDATQAVGSLVLDHEAVDLGVWQQDWACVTDGDLHLVNIATPGAPHLLHSIDTPGTCYGVTVSSQYAYLADGHRGLQIYQLSHDGRIGSYGADADHVAAAGPFVCAAGDFGMSTQFSVLDVSDPAAPILVGSTYDIFTQDLIATGDYAYVAGNNDYYQSGDGLIVVDITTPEAPVVVAAIAVPGEARGITLADDLLLVVDGLGLRVFDLTDPSLPALIGELETPGTTYSVAADGQYAYLANGSSVLIVDIDDPCAPFVVGSVAGGTWYREIALAGEVLIAGGSSTIQCVDISIPTAPQALGSLTLLAPVTALSASGHYVYAAADWSGVHVVDIGNPTDPILVGTLPANAHDVLHFGDALIVGGGYQIVIAHLQCDVPLILAGSVQATVTPGSRGSVDWSFQWRTPGMTDPQFDRVTIQDVDGVARDCELGVLELTGGAEPTPSLEGGYLHTVTTTRSDCSGDCRYAFRVSSQRNGLIGRSGEDLVFTSECGATVSGPMIVKAPRFRPSSPNPFNPRTTLSFYVPGGAQRYELSVFDQRGRLVRTLASGEPREGWQEVVWSGDDAAGCKVASGLYFACLKVDDHVQVQKLAMLK